MSDTIEAAKSGRAGCRGCKAKIAKGELRNDIARRLREEAAGE